MNNFNARAAWAKAKPAAVMKPNRLILVSDCTSHVTPHGKRVHYKTECDVIIRLVGDPSVSANFKGVRTVMWHTDEGTQGVNLFETLVTPEEDMSQLSVPSLVREQIGALFIPGKAVLIDLADDFKVLGFAEQDRDRLFYIADRISGGSRDMLRGDRQVTAMVSIANEHYDALAVKTMLVQETEWDEEATTPEGATDDRN